MKWVTRKRIHVNRTATGWLIRRFLDPSAEILFVEPEEVASIQDDARRRRLRRAGRPTSPQGRRRPLFLRAARRGHACRDDPALAALARIVHGADFPEEIDATPESAGLWAISQGFTDVSSDDAEILERAAFLYDSLYAHLRRREGVAD